MFTANLSQPSDVGAFLLYNVLMDRKYIAIYTTADGEQKRISFQSKYRAGSRYNFKDAEKVLEKMYGSDECTVLYTTYDYGK